VDAQNRLAAVFSQKYQKCLNAFLDIIKHVLYVRRQTAAAVPSANGHNALEREPLFSSFQPCWR
jgi:hypothetical protein